MNTASSFKVRLLSGALLLALLGAWEWIVLQWGLSALVLPAP